MRRPKDNIPDSKTGVVRRLMERRAVLDHGVTPQDTSATAAVMARSIPQPTLLLAITDRLVRRWVVELVADAGVIIDEAQSTGQALEKARSIWHPIVVTSSADLVRKLRSEESAGQTRHILLIVADRDAEKSAGFQAGATDCIGKDASQECFHAKLAIAGRILALEASLQAAVRQSRELSTIDELTRVASRLYFSRHFPREAARAASGGGALSVIMCDIDHFKRVNDTHGHPAGDQVLREFCLRLQRGVRQGTDWIARLGGEEFAVVLPETGYDGALDVARRMRQYICESPVLVGNQKIEITASFGVCGMDVAQPNVADHMLKVADAALYQSKRNGRNRVTATRLRMRRPPAIGVAAL